MIISEDVKISFDNIIEDKDSILLQLRRCTALRNKDTILLQLTTAEVACMGSKLLLTQS